MSKKNKKCSNSENDYINRYGVELGKKYFNEVNNRRKATLSEYFNSLSKEERKILFDTNSVDSFKRRFGEDWEEKYFLHHKNLQAKASKASKESMRFFNKLLDKILDLNVKYYIGTEGNNEWFIYDKKYKQIRFFDFCIPELNIIIEFHGSIWHYNENYNYNRALPFGMVLEENRKNDVYKRQLAEYNGFKYFVVFDTDNYEEKAEQLTKEIKKQYGIKYGKRDV